MPPVSTAAASDASGRRYTVPMHDRPPDPAAIRAAAERIAAHIVATPLRAVPQLAERMGAGAVFAKLENRQKSGAFKYRGASNAVWSLGEAEAARGVIAHSSGNHGAALALAAKTRGIVAHIVVPSSITRAKRVNIERHGGLIHVCEPTLAAREAMTTNLQGETGANLVHPFADARVIAGQGTLAREMLDAEPDLDALLTPIGGGGLVSGCAIAAHGCNQSIGMFAAEPEGAADALASLAAGHRVTDIRPDTICDGLGATIGAINFACLVQHEVTVLPVSDDEVREAMQLFADWTGEHIEPSSATVIAALLRHPEHFAGKRIGIVITGGNIA